MKLTGWLVLWLVLGVLPAMAQYAVHREGDVVRKSLVRGGRMGVLPGIYT